MLTTLLTALSFLFLAAHGLRTGSNGVTLFWLAAAALSFAPWRWKHLVLACLLVFGTWLWADIALRLVQVRLAHGLPYHRLAAIIGAVSLCTLFAAGLQFRAGWQRRESDSVAQAMVFLLAVGGLSIARQKASLPILLADRFFVDGGWPLIFMLGCYAALIVGKMLPIGTKTAWWRRTLWTLFSVVFFTQLLLGLAGFERFLMTGTLHLPVPALIAAGPLYRGEGFFMIILFSATVLLVGPAWCSHLCYIGAWDNLAANAKRKSAVLPTWTKKMRWLLAAVVFLLAFLLRKTGIAAGVATTLAAVFGIVGVGVMLVWSRATGTMTHCLSYCPMGLLADLFGRINPWRIRIHAGCNQCGLCSRVCRYNALQPADVQKRRAGFTCSLCGDCLATCPHGHLHYCFPGLGSGTARTAFLVVVVALHAIFLGVARL
jgi:ferredoxin